jgi:hypothetical protein
VRTSNNDLCIFVGVSSIQQHEFTGIRRLEQSGSLSRYSNRLHVPQPGFDSPAGQDVPFSIASKPTLEAQAASYPISIVRDFPGVKRAVREADQ